MTATALGEVRFEARGAAYVMVLDVRTISAVERRLDRGIGQLFPHLMRGRFEYVHELMWEALQRHHKGLTRDDAFGLMEALGMAEAAKLVGEGIKWVMPKDEEGGAADGARPPAAPGAGTGSASSPPGAD
jgi:hypothetical protein